MGEVEALRIGFGTFPIILIGFLFGPLAGASVGAVANLLGALISLAGAVIPQFILVAALGRAYRLFFGKFSGALELSLAFFSIAICLFLNSVLLISYFMNTLYGTPSRFMLLGRLIGF